MWNNFKLLTMKSNSDLIFKIMNIVFWIVFIGLCIKTGAILYSFLVSYFYDPLAAKDLYLGIDLSELLAFDKIHFLNVASITIVALLLKTYLSFLVLQIFRKLDLENPFTLEISKLITNISYFSFIIGILYNLGNSYKNSILKKDVFLPQLDWNSDEFLFIAGIIFVISLVFKKGIELQTENELTV